MKIKYVLDSNDNKVGAYLNITQIEKLIIKAERHDHMWNTYKRKFSKGNEFNWWDIFDRFLKKEYKNARKVDTEISKVRTRSRKDPIDSKFHKEYIS